MKTNYLLLIPQLLICLTAFCQMQTTIYFFPGQGSDKRIFDSLTIDPSFKLKFVEYGTPDKKVTLKQFAQQLSKEIDTTEKFILIGVSLGGMLCSELSEILKPEKTIIISSAKNRSELPLRYRFQKYFPLYALFPGSFLLAGAKLMQPIVEPDRNKNKEVFKSMLGKKDSKYLKRTIKMIIRWDKDAVADAKIIHIHGSNDHTLPFKKITSPQYVIPNGSHMMTLTRAAEISEILNKLLK